MLNYYRGPATRWVSCRNHVNLTLTLLFWHNILTSFQHTTEHWPEFLKTSEFVITTAQYKAGLHISHIIPCCRTFCLFKSFDQVTLTITLDLYLNSFIICDINYRTVRVRDLIFSICIPCSKTSPLLQEYPISHKHSLLKIHSSLIKVFKVYFIIYVDQSFM